jgi:hypothetical protein
VFDVWSARKPEGNSKLQKKPVKPHEWSLALRKTLKPLVFLVALTLPGTLPADAQISPDTRAVVAANTSFALNLYSRLKTADGNLFFSPYSISTALAMTYGGARGQTARQMADTLGFWIANKDVVECLLAKRADLNVKDSTGKTAVDNQSWAIPYVGDVSTNATFTVSDPTLGDIDSKGVFAAKKPGKVTIKAVIRVVTSLGGDKVLELTEKVPAGTPVAEFRNQIELTITN